MTRRSIIIVVIIVIIVLSFIALWRNRSQFGLWWPGGPELVQNGSFESGDFEPSRPDEIVISPVDFGPPGNIIHLANAAKLLHVKSGALDNWQIAGTGNGLPTGCDRKTTGPDAVGWDRQLKRARSSARRQQSFR